jgi:hypothetical protein
MFGGIFDKAITATISLGMMLFSSYQGDTPSFSQSRAFRQGNEITVQATLKNAFNDDFRQILQSGQRVDIIFTLSLSDQHRSEIINFSHIAHYDPLLELWTLTCEERDKTFKIESWGEFKNAASDFYYQGIHYLSSPLEIVLYASLPTIVMGRNQKSFDLMIFWNYRTPECRKSI